jgi:hypothetical protein
MTQTSSSIQLAHNTQTEWAILAEQAVRLAKSDLLPASYYGSNGQTRNYELAAHKVVAVSMMGAELGIPPWAAINNITVIQGKPTISPQLMLALIHRSGKLRNIKIEVTDDAATCTMHRTDMEEAHSETFSMKDAQRMQFTSKDNWNKQPKTMMKWRAVAACARIVFPDIVLGFYTQEEMGANVTYDEGGSVENFVEGHVVDTPPASADVPKLPNESAVSETTSAASGGSDEAHPFKKGDQIAGQKLIEYFTHHGYVGKDKKVDWTRVLEEIRAMTGQSVKAVGEITGYATPEAFFEAMDAHFKTIADTMPKAAPKSGKKKFEWTDELVKANGEWMLANFGLAPEFGLVNAEHGKIGEYADQDAYRADVIRLALNGAWQINSESVSYAGKDSPIVFQTAIGDVRFYGRTKLRELIGDELFVTLDLEKLTDNFKGTLKLPMAVKVDWKKQGDPGHEYFVAENIQSADEIPF